MDLFNIAFRLGYPHPDLYLSKLTTTQVTEMLAYAYIDSGNFDKRENSAKNLKNSLAHLVKK